MVTSVLNRLKSQYYTWDDVNVVFIVSTGRTATKFFSEFFDDSFDHIVARHEPEPDLFDLGINYIRNSYSRRRTNALLKYYRYSMYQELQRHNISTYLESNNNATLLLPIVKEVFPRLKVVFITRDPRSYLISAYSKSHGHPGYKLYGDDDPRDRLTAKDFKDDPLNQRWDQLTRFEKLCWHWKTYNQITSSVLDDSLDHLTLKYEDLFCEGDFRAVRKLVEFVGVEPAQQSSDQILTTLMARKSNQSAAYEMSSFERWDEKKKQSFNDILGDEAARYGY